MKVQGLLDELRETEAYKNFKTENPTTFFVAGFFVIDLESKTESIQLDFFLPDQDKIAIFEHPFDKPKISEEEIKQMQLQTTKIKIDIDDLELTCKTIIKKKGSAIIPTKIIAILKDNQWNLTCMDNTLGIVRIKLDAITGEQIEFNKGSLMDFASILRN